MNMNSLLSVALQMTEGVMQRQQDFQIYWKEVSAMIKSHAF
ncbi:hypothetical protein [Piscirickettsia salmonis]